MWHLQQEAENKQHEEIETDSRETEVSSPAMDERRLAHELSLNLSPELKTIIDQFPEKSGEAEVAQESDFGPVIDGETAEDTAPVSEAIEVSAKSLSPWASATETHAWLKSLHPKSPFGIWLAKHRADVYVGAAVLLLLMVLSGWGMRPTENRPQSKNSQPNLTLFEKLLVSLGLAETPPTPVYLGNPNAQVWVDLHTALYYCSGSDLYGKTAGGKFTTQRDAQMDQFEPAARKNCD
jgi:hypothetical protein